MSIIQKGVAPALALSLVAACGGQAETQAPICRSGSGLAASNSIVTNGILTNGYSNNAIHTNGINMQGVNMQGISMQGENLNGVRIAGIALDRSTLVAIAEDGSILGPIDLVGATVAGITSEGTTIPLTFTAMEKAGDLTYYALATEDGSNICGAEGKGLFVPGVWDEAGARRGSLGEGDALRDTTFSCTTGVIAKCVSWGYTPWSAGTELHQTCTRMARADYCGDGQPHTENGTLIDLFDVQGIQVPTLGTDLTFEAGWGPDGAVCVHKTRYTDIGAGGRVVLPSCWSDKPSCAGFDEAIDRGAQIGNASGTSSRYLCED